MLHVCEGLSQIFTTAKSGGGLLEGWGDDLVDKSKLCKSENLSSNRQQPCKKKIITRHACDSSIEGQRQ